MHATSDMLMADRFWGERSRLAYAMKTQLDFGASLALGSDAPVESPNPFLGLHAAVTRQRADGSPSAEGWYPEQKLTMAEAFAGYTLGAAYAAYMEDRLGRLAPGFLADLIVLKDPFTCNPNELLSRVQQLTENGFGKTQGFAPRSSCLVLFCRTTPYSLRRKPLGSLQIYDRANTPHP
jgi:predicted amidohydrolase YtcJ